MSGGAYDYTYARIQTLAEDIHATSELRAVFKKHLAKVAETCRAIEWVDSGDYGPGDEDKLIKECLGERAGELILEELLAQADELITKLNRQVRRLKK
jgi:hypothetical protein